jgi:hypothetical protein
VSDQYGKRWRGGVDWHKWGVALIVMVGESRDVPGDTTVMYVEPWQIHVQVGPWWGDVRGRFPDTPGPA